MYDIGDLSVIDAQVRVTHEDDADEDDDDDKQVLKSVGCDSLLISLMLLLDKSNSN